MKRRDTGILGEKLARDFLKKRGYRVLETNYRRPEGEIDIVPFQNVDFYQHFLWMMALLTTLKKLLIRGRTL